MYSGRIETCGRRISLALSMRGMKQAELCTLAKIPKGSLSLYVSGAYEPKQDRLSKIADVLDVDPVWLMGYDVPMEREKKTPDKLELSEGDKAILEIFRLIPEEQRRAFLEMGRAYANSLKKD